MYICMLLPSDLRRMIRGVMRIHRFCVFFVLVSTCFMLLNCSRTPEKRFEMKGKVVSVDTTQRQAMIDHEKIPGFMDAMTMPFNIGDDWALEVLAPGQSIEATLVVKGDRSWIERIRISQGDSSGTAGTAKAMPQIGEEVPDFQLINQDGKQIRLSQFRGSPLLLTFVYTRCPLPDFCPRTSSNFSEVYRGLISNSQSGRGPHLLTISFDTDHDTPAVLREYARRYMNPPDHEIWEFATGSPEDIRKITGYFGLIYREESGQFAHTLVTALIGSDGKIRQLYQGNRWTPSQVLAELR